MNITNNIIKYHLPHVYWVFGTACAGKTATTEYLSKEYNLTRYDGDNRHKYFMEMSDPINQPEMNRKFSNWEEYFNRTPEQYSKWLNDSINEKFDMIIIDLLTMPKDKPIIVDSHCTTDKPTLISDYNHIIYLTSRKDLAMDQFMERDDKSDLYKCIMNLSNPDKTLQNVYDTLQLGHKNEYDRIINSGMKYIIRQDDTKVESMAKLMAEHFKLEMG